MDLFCVGACKRPAETIYRGMALCVSCFAYAMHQSEKADSVFLQDLRDHNVRMRADHEAWLKTQGREA